MLEKENMITKEQEVNIAKEVLFEKQIIVMKFGGSSVANADRIRHAAGIVRDYSRGASVVVVVSAMQGVTDKLYEILNAVDSNNLAQAEGLVNFLGELHRNTARLLAHDQSGLSDLDLAINKFRTGILRYAQYGCVHPSDKDTIVSYGERFSPLLFVEALKNYGMDSQAVDAASVITTDGQFGNAMVNLRLSQFKARESLSSLITANNIPIIGGFYGVSEEGKVSILGRGGSDYTAAALANVLNARELILWKEVDGVYSADPKVDEEAQFYSELTYKEALLLASNGAKILHPEAMKPVAERQIPVYVRNTFRPEFSGTRIWEGKND